MHVKSYYAATVESAIRQARQELGSEAMLLHSRVAPPESRHLGAYEAVFASSVEAAPPEAPRRAPAPDRVAGELAEIRRQLDRMSLALSRVDSRPSGLEAWGEEVYAELAANGLAADLALRAARAVDAGGASGSPERTRRILEQELGKLFQVAPGLDLPASGQAGPRIAALVGPPGVGRTSALVKLATRHGLVRRRTTQILSLDCDRVAAGEPLRSYATILGVAYDSVDDPGALADAIAEYSRKQLILLDTPGFGPGDWERAAPVAEALAALAGVETHLVLSCAMKPSDLMRVADRYLCFAPSRLLFTRLDETSSYGTIVNEAVRLNLPISFLSTGQRVPGDFEPAAKARVLDLVLSGSLEEEIPAGAAAAGGWGSEYRAVAP